MVYATDGLGAQCVDGKNKGVWLGLAIDQGAQGAHVWTLCLSCGLWRLSGVLGSSVCRPIKFD